MFYQPFKKKISFLLKSLVKPASILIRISPVFLFLIWRPPALPHRLQCSTIGRLGLNRRVRDGNGCVPQAHRHQKFPVINSARAAFPTRSVPLCFTSREPRLLCIHSLTRTSVSKLPASSPAMSAHSLFDNSTAKQPLLILP